ncbi:unnamed protein product [Phytomonas sp. Hart1]|nr:unnamed protein product [Phytomonas sp. Hart1]|eukprot:CCW68783.1 unnamed protein product [Phytomonas sp. isolate Hart1]
MNAAPMLFCARCSNLLYPECDPQRSMLWRCNYCQTTEIHDEYKMVHVLNLKIKSDTMGETDLLEEFASDPTAQRDPTKKCPKCEHNDVTCFVNPLGQPQEDMTLYFACANPRCRFVWKSEDI